MAKKISPTYEITLVGMFSAVNIASRMYLQFLPNIKPVTSIIILCAIFYGWRISVEVVIVTVLVSGLLLGLGTFIPFQILAWIIVASLAIPVAKFVRNNLVCMAIYSCLSGFIYGFVVSWEKLFLFGSKTFLPYYISGLYFDVLHAFGNLAFYLICAPIIANIFIHNISKENNYD